MTLVSWFHTEAQAQARTVNFKQGDGSALPFASEPTGVFTIRIAFTGPADVEGFTADDIQVDEGAKVTGFSRRSNKKSFDVTITPKVTGTLTVTVPANAITSSPTNAAGSEQIEVNLGAKIMVMEPEGEGPYNEQFDVKIMFTNDFAGSLTFGENYITLSDTDLADVTVSEDLPTFTATITPKDDKSGELTISVPAHNDIKTSGDTPYTASNTITVNIDTVDPTVTAITPPSGPQKEAFDVDVRFSEDVDGFEADDVTLNGGTGAANVTNVTEVSGSRYTVKITPTADGTVPIAIRSNAARDAAGNMSVASASGVDGEVTIDQTKPTVTIGSVSGTKNADFSVAITLSEDVTGFAEEDITVSPSTLAAVVVSSLTGSGTSRTATISPKAGQAGTLTISVAADKMEDMAGNGNKASNSQTVSIDKKGPEVTFGTPPATPQKDAFNLGITLSETSTNFATEDITLDPTGRASVAVTGSGTAYTVRITPTEGQEGDVKLKIAAGAMTDSTGNGNAAKEVTVKVDKKKPTATITGLPSGEENDAFNLTITFSEDVTGFAKADLTVTGEATATAVSGSGKNWTAEITPNTNKEGNVTVKVDADAATDTAGNGNAASTATSNIHIDTIAPTATMGTVTGEKNAAFNLTITFSEDVTKPAKADLTVTGEATVMSVSGTSGGRTYTARIKPNANKEGDVTVKVDAGAVTDDAGNENPASSPTGNIHIDTKRPTVSISGLPSGEQNAAFNLTITFNEDVTGFAKEDLMVTGPATATATAAVGNSKKEYTATITPASNREGDVTVKVKANTVKDAADNGNTVSTATSNIHIDTIDPTLTITAPTTPQNGTFDVTFTFNEDVTGFVPGDVTFGNARLSGNNWKSSTATTYTLRVQPTASAGQENTVTIDVAANKAMDAANNGNAAATRASVSIDKKVPTLTIDAPSDPQNGPFDVTFTFNENVTGFVPADVTVTNANKAGSWKSSTATTYKLTLTPTATAGQENTVTIDVATNKAQDAAKNGNAAATRASVSIDKKVPTVSISGVPTSEQKGAFNLTITFSENVTGFATNDLTVTGEATATAVSGTSGGTTYTAEITPNANKEGDITVQVKANAVKDAADNDNTASTATSNIHIDTIVPTVTIKNIPTIEKNDAYDLTIEFNEAVDGFAVPGDLTVTGPGTVTLKSGAAGAAVYVVTVTPSATMEGDVAVSVNANTILDKALNANSAGSNTATVHVDTIVPTVTIKNAPTIEKNVAYDLTIEFNEAVNGFSVADDLTVTLTKETGVTSADPIAAVTLKSGADGDSVYVVTVTPNASGAEGDVAVTVDATSILDEALNANPAGSNTATVHIDTIVPTVSVSGFPSGEQKDPYDLTVTFSEVVNGFAADDVTFGFTNTSGASPSATATVKSGADGDDVYTVTITPNAAGAEADVTVTINAVAVKDFALNDNTASPEMDVVHIDNIKPTVSVSDVPTEEKNEPYDIKLEFSEPVKGFTLITDLRLTVLPQASGPVGRAQESLVSAALKSGADGDSEYIVTITPSTLGVEADLKVTLLASTVTDDASNTNEVSMEMAVGRVDTIEPTVAIQDIPQIEENDPYDLTIRFSEPVTDFSVADDLTVTLTNEPGVTSASPLAAVALKSGAAGAAVYVVTVTPNTAGVEGDVTVSVKADAVKDNAMNANPAGSNAATVHVDTIAPTVAVSGFPTTEQNGPYDLTVTFSEPVNGFMNVPADLTLTGPATAALATGSNGDAVYTVTITPNPTAEGGVTVTVDANSVQDFALNDNTASTETTSVHVDTIIPTVSVTGYPDPPPSEENGPFTLTVTFSEPVNGFMDAPADLTLTGPVTAALATGADGDDVYTVTITPNATAEGDVTVTVAPGAVQDPALNDNTASPETNVVHVDTIPPTVSVAVTPPTVGADTGYPTEERNEAYTLTVTFSEEVNGFGVPDLTVSGPGTPALASGSDGDAVYTVTITPNATTEGDVTVTVNPNSVQDFATNQNPAGSTPVTVHIDTIAPTFTIEDEPVLQRLNDYFDIRIVFDEPVNDFQVPDDFVASELVTPSLRLGADGDSEYTVRMTPNEGVQGNLFIEFNAEAVQDLALNRNVSSVATTQEVRIDTVAPTVEITDLPTGTKGEPFDVTIVFSEEVNGFTTEDIGLMGPATVVLTTGTAGATTYTAQITPDPDASDTVTLQIPAGVAQDLAGNANLASLLTPPITIDTNALTVELRDVPETVQTGAFSVGIVFSKVVEGFELDNIEIEGDAIILTSTLLGTGSTYTLTITPEENTDGDVIITIPAGAAQDEMGRDNTASVPQVVAVAPSWMPDAVLRDAFREQLGLGAGEDFTQQQIRAITTIESDMMGMRDLTGLEQVVALETLVLAGNEITNITPLQRLRNLTTLNLAGNAITDITPLSGLTELISLDLGANNLTSIDALEDLTGLTTLDLRDNSLTDISLLANFTALTTLNLSGNSITDISALTGLTSLTALRLNANAISDFTPLIGLTSLTTLELGRTGLSSLNAISGLTALTALNLSENTITDLGALANLTALTTLNLSNNNVVDITPLSGLTRLTTLEIADNAITTLTPLTALTLLTYLNASENGITDVSPIAGLTNLETLLLMGNPILNTAPLYPLTQRARPVAIDIAVSEHPPWDVNEDGTVDAEDSGLVTAALGQSGDAIENPRTDVNGDGIVDNADILLVTSNFGGGVAGAPSMGSLLSQLDTETLRTLDRATLETYLNQLRLESDGSLKYRDAIALLEGLLAALRPTETRLLANYPNPFNPETWLPYELAIDTTVEIFIYNARGVLVRHLELGHQPAGYYVAKSRAAYWDGRNRVGERVSSGVYFYELRAGGISQLRKMVILK